MSKISDLDYLRNCQYSTPDNLSIRAHLHANYSTNPIGWLNWVFQEIDFSNACQVLEVGCGPGYLWFENISGLPEQTEIILSDLSEGMLDQSRQTLGCFFPFRYLVVDAQRIPFAESFFDLVIANHMLYHLPDIQAAIREFRRILKPEGRLYAATNGKQHLREIQH
jgi:ubiquinone/menaquinone biosynthesis C-methylase UbiE